MPAGTDRDPGGAQGHGVVTLPNLITFARLCAVPAMVWLILQARLDIAFLVFVGAGLSDALDGWLARVMNARSVLGAIIDPIADKALLVSVYVTMAWMDLLPDWIAILVVFRDALIVGGYLALRVAGQSMVIAPMLISKANTVLQVALAALSLGVAGFQIDAGMLVDAMLVLTGASTVLTGALYVGRAMRRTPG